MLETITSFEIWQISFKIFLCVLVSIVIGYNREALNQTAGVKTHVLVALGGLLSIMIPLDTLKTYHEYLNFDPYRLAGQVITGIGFLGAGTIIRTGYSVKGLTTSASLWLVAILGIGIGANAYDLVLVAFFATLFVLKYLQYILETKKFQKKRILITYHYTPNNAADLNAIFHMLGVSKNSEKIIENKKITDSIIESKVLVEVKYHKHKIDIETLINSLISKKYILAIENIGEREKI